MTALGLLFVVGYAVALRWRTPGVLAVMGTAMPFFDSAAISLGSVAVSPFYLGSILLLVINAPALLRGTLRGTDWLLVALLVVGAATTALGPALFPTVQVVTSATDLDEQVDNLSVVGYSLSGVAQLAYLTLNVGLVLVVKRRGIDRRAVTAGMAVGALVAFSSWLATAAGTAWPVAFFSNSNRNFYADLPDRARAQFAEPSHLGVWALVALSYFAVLVLQAPTVRRAVMPALLGGMAALSFASAASGTAIVGVVVELAVLVVVSVLRLDWAAALRRPVPARAVALIALTSGAVVAAAPFAISALLRTVEDKSGTQSDVTRTFVNEQGLRVLADTAGLGIGLGANRASSLVALLLSTVGIGGLLLFAAIGCVAISRALRADRTPEGVALIAFLAAGAVGFADFSSSVLWLLIAAGWAARADRPSAVLPKSAVRIV